MMETTRMFSDRPGTPERRLQGPPDQEVDENPVLAGLVEPLDHQRIHQGVHLRIIRAGLPATA